MRIFPTNRCLPTLVDHTLRRTRIQMHCNLFKQGIVPVYMGIVYLAKWTLKVKWFRLLNRSRVACRPGAIGGHVRARQVRLHAFIVSAERLVVLAHHAVPGIGLEI